MKAPRVALVVAGAYLIPSLIYIFLSSRLTADLATSPQEAAQFEILKGVTFVLFSAALIFFVCAKMINVAETRRVEIKAVRESLLYAERRSIAGLLARSTAHDARNVLTVLKSNNDLLQRQGQRDELTDELLSEQAEAIERLVEMTDRLSAAGRHEISTKLQTLDLVELVQEACQTLQTHSRLRDCQIDFVPSLKEAPVRAFPPLIYQILINLLLNAAEATDLKGRIEVRIEAQDGGFSLAVHDDGPGIPQAEREKVFEAFYSTRDDGAGLGLLSVKTSAVAHGGQVVIEDSPLGGACVRVNFGERFEDPYESIDGPLLFELRALRADDSDKLSA